MNTICSVTEPRISRDDLSASFEVCQLGLNVRSMLSKIAFVMKLSVDPVSMSAGMDLDFSWTKEYTNFRP